MTKRLVALLSVAFLGGSVWSAGGQPAEPTTCEFSLQGEPAEPAITGPDNIVPLVYVVPQPDSPIELVSIDFEGSYLWVRDEEFTWEPRCKVRVRNGSDQPVEDFQVSVHLLDAGGGVGGWAGPDKASLPNLGAGQEAELEGCGGKGFGGASNDYFRIVVAIDWIELPGCRYIPSMRYPSDLGVSRPDFRPSMVLR